MTDNTPNPNEPTPEIAVDGLSLSDYNTTPKWRIFQGHDEVRPGTSQQTNNQLIWSVSPGEWTIIGPKPDTPQVVDLTHTQTAFRISGQHATAVLNKICALDLNNNMFPNRAAARTLIAGVATELIHDNQQNTPSYLLLPPRSYSHYIHNTILHASHQFRLA